MRGRALTRRRSYTHHIRKHRMRLARCFRHSALAFSHSWRFCLTPIARDRLLACLLASAFRRHRNIHIVARRCTNGWMDVRTRTMNSSELPLSVIMTRKLRFSSTRARGVVNRAGHVAWENSSATQCGGGRRHLACAFLYSFFVVGAGMNVAAYAYD